LLLVFPPIFDLECSPSTLAFICCPNCHFRSCAIWRYSFCANSFYGLIVRHHIQVVVAQSPYEGFGAALAIKVAACFGYKVGLAVEVHGDFEESLFLYRRIRFRALHRFLMKQASLYSLAQAEVLRTISKRSFTVRAARKKMRGAIFTNTAVQSWYYAGLPHI
jgi:hypothetical protein